jgi:hypothetical protein
MFAFIKTSHRATLKTEKKGMYTLVSYMYNFDSVQITVVLNVQNFGKCLSFNVSSVAGFDEGKHERKVS